MQIKNKKSILASAIGAVTMPVIAFAQTIGSMASAIAGQVVIVGTWIVVIFWIVTGILFLSSVGDPSKVKTARDALFASIAGTVVIILANGAIKFVGNSFGI